MPANRRAVPVAWSAYLLIGWSNLLLPSLVRQVEGRFSIDDAALGFLYLVSSLAYAVASFGGGFLTERFGRRIILAGGTALFAGALGLEGSAPSWAAFLIAAPFYGLGGGAIDGGSNALLLAVVQTGRARALNLLHLFFSIGAFVSPFLVGRLVSAGVDWPLILLASAVAAAFVALAFALVPMPSGKRTDAAGGGAVDGRSPDSATAAPAAGRGPLVLLGIAIACYVAAEVGVSDWVVRFLDRADLETATLALSGFWAGLAVGRLASAAVGDRLPHARFAAAASFAMAVAVVVAVLSPSIELSIGAFAIAGFASGPIFPLIIAIGGDRYPERLAATAGTLTAAGVIGGTFYPSFVGFMSASVGIGAGILGAGFLSVVCGVLVLAARRGAR